MTHAALGHPVVEGALEDRRSYWGRRTPADDWVFFTAWEHRTQGLDHPVILCELEGASVSPLYFGEIRGPVPTRIAENGC